MNFIEHISICTFKKQGCQYMHVQRKLFLSVCSPNHVIKLPHDTFVTPPRGGSRGVQWHTGQHANVYNHPLLGGPNSPTGLVHRKVMACRCHTSVLDSARLTEDAGATHHLADEGEIHLLPLIGSTEHLNPSFLPGRAQNSLFPVLISYQKQNNQSIPNRDRPSFLPDAVSFMLLSSRTFRRRCTVLVWLLAEFPSTTVLWH